jgi:hypothetical protein
LSEKAYFKECGSKKHHHGNDNVEDTQTKIKTYKIKLHVDSHFGTPRAFVIQNKHKKKLYLLSASIETCTNRIIHFDCNSWIYPIKKTKFDRLFFSNRVSSIIYQMYFLDLLAKFLLLDYMKLKSCIHHGSVIFQVKHLELYWN